jgi:PAS domain S-box-containing protein
MRLGIRAREAVAVTLLTFLVVATTTVIHLSRLSRVVAQEAERQAELIARQIYAQSRQTIAAARRVDPREALRRDRELRNLLESSVGYSPHLLYALVADQSGRIILHTEPAKEGGLAPAYPGLSGLADLGPVSRFDALYRGAQTYEATLPLALNGAPFGSIRLGVSTTLLRRELGASLRQSLTLAGIALPLAWLAAMGLAHLALRPVRALAGEVERIRRGEFSASPAPAGAGDEFQELSAQLQRLGRELHADRLATLSEKAHLQHVVDQLEDGVIFLSRETKILFFNKAAEEVVGRPLEHAVGAPLAELLPASHPVRALVERALDGRADARNATITLAHGEERRECLVSVFPVEDAREVMGAVVLVKDLESIKTVQSLVSYSAKLAALGRLTSGIAHEVKNPLNAMMIHLELLKDRLDGAPGDVQRSLEVMGGEIRRLDRVVQGFLRFMRPQELAFKTLDLNALLASVTALVEAEWQGRGIRFACALDPALPAISADEELLRQAFLNVLQNACQAMPAGGEIAVRTERAGRESIRVAVQDQGVGIRPEDLEKIFTLYYTTKPDGNGIGLSIVYRIIQLHDGLIEATSELGRGSTMLVRLPVRSGV